MQERCLPLSLGLDMGILGLVRILCIFCVFLPLLSRLSLWKELGRLSLSLSLSKIFNLVQCQDREHFVSFKLNPVQCKDRARELCFSYFIRRWGTLYHYCTVHASPSSIHFCFFCCLECLLISFLFLNTKKWKCWTKRVKNSFVN